MAEPPPPSGASLGEEADIAAFVYLALPTTERRAGRPDSDTVEWRST